MSDELDENMAVRRRPDVLHSQMDDTVFALQVRSGVCFSFDGPSARLWDLLEEPVTAAAAARRLTQEYEVEEGACRAEVLAYFRRLLDEDLIIPAR